MTKPIIGIVLDCAAELAGDDVRYGLMGRYAKAVASAGGIPVLIPYEGDLILEYLDMAQGFVFPGGDDINPKYYNEAIGPHTKTIINDMRTEFELEFLGKIIESKKPFLGICAGLQLLNVALGGTLYQDIETEIETEIKHKNHGLARDEDHHDIEIVIGTKLHEIMGVTLRKTNSHHHQSVKALGKDLIVAAKAADGIVEAIELEGHPFCIGVEWHPEYMKNKYDRKLMETFIQVASTELK